MLIQQRELLGNSLNPQVEVDRRVEPFIDREPAPEDLPSTRRFDCLVSSAVSPKPIIMVTPIY
jgi:hypothetical protein